MTKVLPSICDANVATSSGDIEIAAGAAGEVACWGDNRGNVLGTGIAPGQASAEPVPVPEVDDALQVFTDHDLSCALRRGGRVTCWGAASPGAALTTIADAQSVVLAREQGCAVRRNGRLACWGHGVDGGFQNSFSNLEGVSAVSLGQRHGCALRRRGGGRGRRSRSWPPA